MSSDPGYDAWIAGRKIRYNDMGEAMRRYDKSRPIVSARKYPSIEIARRAYSLDEIELEEFEEIVGELIAMGR